MKFIALIGSLRRDSYNRKVFEAYKKLNQEVEIIEGRFDDFPLYNDDIKEVGFPDTVTRLSEQIRQSDGVLFFSPEYNYSVPGVLKNALDWISRVPNQPFATKPVALISASPGKLGGARMQYHFRQIGVFLDMQILNKPEIMISEVHKKVNERGEFSDADTLNYLKKHIEQFLAFAQKVK